MKYLLQILAIWIAIYSDGNIVAEVLYLKNGDRITGDIVSRSEEIIVFNTKSLGEIKLNNDCIDHIEGIAFDSTEGKDEKPKYWHGKIAAGFNKSSGNTRNDQIIINMYINRKTLDNEITAKADAYYLSSNKTLEDERWYGMGRYAYSFWGRKWYNFYRLEGDHDRFANINYRIIPATGLGYWFADTQNCKAMVECGVGYEYVKFIDNEDKRKQIVFIPRLFLEKRLFVNTTLSEELSLYNETEDLSKYRMCSETILKHQINESFSLCFTLIDEYNTNPSLNTEKNDIRVASSLEYSF